MSWSCNNCGGRWEGKGCTLDQLLYWEIQDQKRQNWDQVWKNEEVCYWPPGTILVINEEDEL